MNERYTVGIDFGTESGRAVLVDCDDGRELATAVYPYRNGVVDQHLPPPDDDVGEPYHEVEVTTGERRRLGSTNSSIAQRAFGSARKAPVEIPPSTSRVWPVT